MHTLIGIYTTIVNALINLITAVYRQNNLHRYVRYGARRRANEKRCLAWYRSMYCAHNEMDQTVRVWNFMHDVRFVQLF